MTKRKALSKTKALATRRKMIGSTTAVFKPKTDGKPRDVLLGQLMETHLVDTESSLSFADILSSLGMNDRNTKWRNAWKDLRAETMTEQAQGGPFFTSGFRLTAQGVEEASTEELKELMEKNKAANETKKPHTNTELHDIIKSKLMNKRGEQIFDLLVENRKQQESCATGMTRKELSKALGISDTGAYFSYALQQLKDLGYAENKSSEKGKGKKVCLTDKAFVDGEDGGGSDMAQNVETFITEEKEEEKKTEFDSE